MKTKKTRIERVEPSLWHSTAKRFSDFNYEQSKDYAVSMAKNMGGIAEFYAVYDENKIIGAASVRIKRFPLLGRGVAYISGGPLVKSRDKGSGSENHRATLIALKRELLDRQKHNLMVRAPVTLSPESELEENFENLGFHKTQRVRSYRTILVDVTPDTEVLRARLSSSSWRRHLNYANRTDLAIEQAADSSLDSRFLNLFSEMHDVKNFDVSIDPKLILGLPAESLGRVIFIATKDGKDAAGHVLSLLGDGAVYLFGATNELGRSTKAGYLLQWKSILFTKQLGLNFYDLGGIDPNDNLGGYQFKSRMGGKDVMAVGPYESRPGGIIASTTECLLALRDRLKTVSENPSESHAVQLLT